MNELLLGLSLGFGAGIAPGPLLALVLSSTLQRGFGAGTRVALAPLVTDVPIVVLSVLVLSGLPDTVVSAFSVAGGLFVGWLGVEALRGRAAAAGAAGGDLRRAALVNVISPHPWIFWITVGAPILVEAGGGGAAIFIAAFYVLLIGTKVVIAALVMTARRRMVTGSALALRLSPQLVAASGRRLTGGRGYRIAVRASAVALLAAGAALVAEGVSGV